MFIVLQFGQWEQDGCLKSKGICNTHVAHNTQSDVAGNGGVCISTCVFLHGWVQLGAVFCVHLVFPADDLMYIPMQTSY